MLKKQASCRMRNCSGCRTKLPFPLLSPSSFSAGTISVKRFYRRISEGERRKKEELSHMEGEKKRGRRGERTGEMVPPPIRARKRNKGGEEDVICFHCRSRPPTHMGDASDDGTKERRRRKGGGGPVLPSYLLLPSHALRMERKMEKEREKRRKRSRFPSFRTSSPFFILFSLLPPHLPLFF